MAELRVFPYDMVLRAVSPAEAIERVRSGFVEHASGEWEMPPKTYIQAPPGGDFRAMPAKGGGIAILKWVTSFPGNPAAGLPVVMGAICVSSADDGELLALVDVRAVTALRTGAVAAVAAQELARPDAQHGGHRRLRAARRLGGALPGRRRVRAGRLLRPRPRRGRTAGGRARLGGGQPGRRARLRRRDLRHARRRAGDRREPTCAPASTSTCWAPTARARPRPSPPRWPAASSSATSGSRPPTAASSPGRWRPGSWTARRVTQLGDVLTGAAPGRSGDEAATLFDSTGLAIQDLAICLALLEAERERARPARRR